jgi:hypothetical protein
MLLQVFRILVFSMRQNDPSSEFSLSSLVEQALDRVYLISLPIEASPKYSISKKAYWITLRQVGNRRIVDSSPHLILFPFV